MDSSEDNPGFFSNLADTIRRVPGAALMFAIGPLVLLGYFGWFFYGAEHLDQALYSLRKENIQITPQPEWIRNSQILDEVFDNAGMSKFSLLDPKVNSSVAQAFETHTWIKSAARVTKNSSGKVVVDLVYRCPKAMVYYEATPGNENPDDREYGFYAIDDDGYVLPDKDFESTDVHSYFMLFASGAQPAGNVGMAFGDARISEALHLCRFLEDQRESLGLEQIWVHHDSRLSGPSPWTMTIVTKDQHVVVWGHCPEFESVGEPKALDKGKTMVTWLRKARQSAQPLQIDLRSPGTPKMHPVSIQLRP